MHTTRREQTSMQIDRIHRGTAGRLLTAILAALALSIALGVGSASARTVYDYEYSGFYIDGSGSSKGQFTNQISGPEYDETTETLIVPVGTEPGYATKFNKDGTPAQFSGTGSDTVTAGGTGFGNSWSNAEIAIDNSGGPKDGNFYVTGGFFG